MRSSMSFFGISNNFICQLRSISLFSVRKQPLSREPCRQMPNKYPHQNFLKLRFSIRVAILTVYQKLYTHHIQKVKHNKKQQPDLFVHLLLMPFPAVLFTRQAIAVPDCRTIAKPVEPVIIPSFLLVEDLPCIFSVKYAGQKPPDIGTGQLRSKLLPDLLL